MFKSIKKLLTRLTTSSFWLNPPKAFHRYFTVEEWDSLNLSGKDAGYFTVHLPENTNKVFVEFVDKVSDETTRCYIVNGKMPIFRMSKELQDKPEDNVYVSFLT